jgi:hypothetical protein
MSGLTFQPIHDDDDDRYSVPFYCNSWDKVYEREVQNFEDHGDQGEVWYGLLHNLPPCKMLPELLIHPFPGPFPLTQVR